MCLLYIFSLLWPHFDFDMLFFIRTAIRAEGGFQATACQREIALYSFIFVHIPYFIFLSQATFILGESSETIILFVDSGGSEVGHVPLDV